MKSILFLFIFFIIISSCSKEDNDKRIIYVTINGEEISFSRGIAQKYLHVSEEVAIGYDYFVMNQENPHIYMIAYDSIPRGRFVCPDNLIAKFSFIDSLNGLAQNYTAISGSLEIIEETKKLIKGNFSFTMVGGMDSDTLKLENGYFEITLERYKALI
jgi:hypothetical protein